MEIKIIREGDRETERERRRERGGRLEEAMIKEKICALKGRDYSYDVHPIPIAKES